METWIRETIDTVRDRYGMELHPDDPALVLFAELLRIEQKLSESEREVAAAVSESSQSILNVLEKGIKTKATVALKEEVLRTMANEISMRLQEKIVPQPQPQPACDNPSGETTSALEQKSVMIRCIATVATSCLLGTLLAVFFVKLF